MYGRAMADLKNDIEKYLKGELTPVGNACAGKEGTE